MRYATVLLLAIGLAGCAGSSPNSWIGSSPNTAGGRFGEPMASNGPTPRQATGPGIGSPRAAATTAAFVTTPENSAYKIGPLDVLDISVFQVPDLTKTVQVADTGTINLPLVGEIPVAGRTAQEVERDLTARLGTKYLQDPQVTVYVKNYNSAQVTIDGAVRRPGVYPMKGKTSLTQLVAVAGGMDENSDWTVLVIRQSDGKLSAAKFNLSAIQKGDAEDPPLQAGDKIVAGTSAIKTAFNTLLKALPIAGTAESVPTAPVATGR